MNKPQLGQQTEFTNEYFFEEAFRVYENESVNEEMFRQEEFINNR